MGWSRKFCHCNKYDIGCLNAMTIMIISNFSFRLGFIWQCTNKPWSTIIDTVRQNIKKADMKLGIISNHYIINLPLGRVNSGREIFFLWGFHFIKLKLLLGWGVSVPPDLGSKLLSISHPDFGW